jgi:hypothetical protein
MKGAPCLYKGMTVKQMIPSRLAHPTASGINYDVVPFSESDGARDYALQRYRNFYQGLNVRRMVLPHDVKQSQAVRQSEWNRQSSMPWGSVFMVTPTDKERLSNPGVAAARKQKQLAPPSSYGQFYAFMKAMSAAFGTIKPQ